MLHKCANPACPSLFRYLDRGKLFLLESDDSPAVTSAAAPTGRRARSFRRVERYWLCDNCASWLTLTFERGRGMVTVPLPPRTTLTPAVHLRQMQTAVKTYPVESKGAL